MVEELKDIVKKIKNYEDLSYEDKQKALEAVYRRQWKCSHGKPVLENQRTLEG
jgi:hypothetical protein